MKKVYFLVNSLEWGWAERVISVIAEKLSENYQVDIITLKNINFYELPESVKYIPLSNVKTNWLMAFLLPYYVFKFRVLLKNNNYKTGISFLEIANFVHILSKKEAIISFRTNINFFVGFVGWIYKIFIKKLYPYAKKIIVNSEENRVDLQQYLNLNSSQVQTICNPIDSQKIERIKHQMVEKNILDMTIWKKVFITVGRLIKSKYHEKIISSFSKIKDKNWVYFIIWDGPERKKLETQVWDLWLGKNIIFLWAQQNVFKYLNISNYFVYASKVEWFPNVLMEAISCNLPIITSDFVSWAKEAILWEYNIELKNMKYPYYWDNWVLLDLENYEESFWDIYDNISKLHQWKKWFERFNVHNVEKEFQKILFN